MAVAPICLILLSVLVACTMVACGGGSSGQTGVGHQTGHQTGNVPGGIPPTPGGQAPGQPVAGKADIGKTATSNGITCSLVAVGTVAADPNDAPAAGKGFVVVRVQFSNGTSKLYTYSQQDFTVKAGDGSTAIPELVPPATYTANLILGIGNLKAGAQAQGDIVFQVPTGDHQAQLVWQPGSGSGGTPGGDSFSWSLGL